MNVSFSVISKLTGNIGIVNLIFDVVLTLVILYPALCDHGNADANLVSFGKLEPDKKRGFIIGLFSYIPFAVLTLPVFLLKIIGSTSFSSYFRLYRVLNSPFLVTLMNLCPDPDINAVSYIDIAIMFVLPLIFVVGCGVFYILGLKRIVISERLIYKR
jgi:hypothetical protein